MLLSCVPEIDAIEAADGKGEDELKEAHDGVDNPEGPAALAVLGAASEVQAHFEGGDGWGFLMLVLWKGWDLSWIVSLWIVSLWIVSL